MAKNLPKTGHSARRGNASSPYHKYDKRPHAYKGDQRTARGELRTNANKKPSNKYLIDG